MITELFMEGVALDLTADVEALLTFAIDDIRQLGTRNTSFSKTITLPGTAANNRAFGNAFMLQAYTPTDNAQPNVAYNFNAARAAQALLTVGRVQVFKGVLRLLAVSVANGQPEYEVSLFGELGGLWSAIAGLMLDDATMGWQDVPATWTELAIVDSWQTPAAGTGLYYPLIDYGAVSTNKVHFDLQAFRPAIYAYDTFKRLVAAAGYAVDSPFLESAFFKSLVIPNTQRDFSVPRLNLLDVSRLTNYTAINSATYMGGPVPLAYTELSVLRGFLASDPTGGGNGSTEFKYNGLAPTRGLLAAGIPINVQKSQPTTPLLIRLRLIKGGVPVREATVTALAGNANYQVSWNGNDAAPVDIAVGEAVQVTAEILPASGAVVNYAVTVGTATLSFNATTATLVPAILGDAFTAREAVPAKFLQRDFLAAVLKMFNLYVTEDRQGSRRLRVTSYPDFYDYASPVDWTEKVDRGGTWRITPLAEAAAKLNYFSYDTDSDYFTDLYFKRYGEAYGSRLYRFDNDFARDKDEIKLPFAGAPLLSYLQRDKRFTALLKFNGATEERTDTKPRILMAAHITGVSYWSIRFAGYVLINRTDYGYAGHLDHPVTPTRDLAFGAPREVFFDLPAGQLYPTANLFNLYWSSYMAEVNDKDAVLLAVPVRLTALDIQDLDFSRPVLLDGVLYRLNKVKDYDSADDTLTEVELLKIIQTT